MTGKKGRNDTVLSLRGTKCRSNLQFKNVVAQFIGQLCLMNQATTKSGGEATWTDTPQVKS